MIPGFGKGFSNPATLSALACFSALSICVSISQNFRSQPANPSQREEAATGAEREPTTNAVNADTMNANLVFDLSIIFSP